MASADFLEGGIGGFPLDDEDDVDDSSHKKLLNAVSSLYRKQRISAPKRNEPSLQISEFNLTKSEQKKKLAPTELLKGLGSKAIHQQIHSKIKGVKSKLRPLPKPLEKFEAEKITRETGYENVKEEVSKWDATIQKNRAADRLAFPLRSSDSISMEPERDILATFSKPTDLELKMAEVLNNSSTLKELKEEAQAEKLTLAQLIQRRNMVAKMRHRESYRIAKAVRQNKIKSKKYHRMLKKDKIRNELKEFELLQKTDPEAALAKLEKVERARAEERISLRHRNTGKWAQGLAIRAKYDAEARAHLAENLRKSREITDKLKASMVSDSEDGADDDEMELDDARKSAGNPWLGPGNEVASFVKGYRKYWEDQNKTKTLPAVVGIKRKSLDEPIGGRGSDEGSENENGTENENGADAIEKEVKAPKMSKTKKRKNEMKKDSDAAKNEAKVPKMGKVGQNVNKKNEMKNGISDVGSEPYSTERSTSDAAKNKAKVPRMAKNNSGAARNKVKAAEKVYKKLIKPDNKSSQLDSVTRGTKLANTRKIGIKSNKFAKAGKAAGRFKSKTQSRYFKITKQSD